MNAAFILFLCMCALLHGAHGQNETILSTQAYASSESVPTTDETPEAPTASTYSRSSAPPSSGPLRTTATTTTTTTNAAPNWMNYKKECLHLYFAVGGLIIVVTILLLCTLILTCKVCQLSRRVARMMSQDGDLISNSDYWMGTARKGKGKPKIDSKETSMLMVDVAPTQEDLGSGDKGEDRNGEAKEIDQGQEGDKDMEEPPKKNNESTAPEAAEQPTTDGV